MKQDVKLTAGQIAWKKHLGKLTVKRRAADMLARKTRRAQYRVK